ncbi:TM1812 family CRISPR-associated protein [bacterium]|nr:TM1812 family CRISPR-associated protein [bacterium]
MKKIVFVTLPLKGNLEKRIYPVDGNSLLEIKEPICFAATAALVSKLKADDEVKIILIETEGGENAGDENAKLFKEELNRFNTVGAKISYETLSNTFDPSKTNFQFTFKTLIKKLEEGAEIYADITFGPKPLAFLLFSVFQFAEKFFNSSIGNIVYSKVEFKAGKIADGSEMIYDVTPLYLMSSITNLIEAPSSERAIQTVETLFEE